MRLLLRLEFDGSPFCGWQIQSREKKLTSIQFEVEKALATALHISEVKVKGCGRTDSGVHAEEFYAHFDVDVGLLEKLSGDEKSYSRGAEKLRHKLNQLLPEEIVSTAIYQVSDDFHACDHVLSKTYEYRILLRRAKPVLKRGRVWWIPVSPIHFDKNLLKNVLNEFVGEHDFKAFAAANLTAKTTIRSVQIIDAQFYPVDYSNLEVQNSIEELLCIRLKAKGFLKQMVRNIVGSSIDVALGKMSLEKIREALSPQNHLKNRKFTGYCAPAHGLFLVEVQYPSGLRRPLGNANTER